MPRPQNELSRILELSDAANDAAIVPVSATPQECEALSERFDVRAVRSLEGEVVFTPHAEGYEAKGIVGGAVEQICGVTGQVLINTIKSQFDILFIEKAADLNLDAIEEAYRVDEVVPLHETTVDVGDLCAQYFALEINPFARAEGAQIDDIYAPPSSSPFDALKTLKDKSGKNGA